MWLVVECSCFRVWVGELWLFYGIVVIFVFMLVGMQVIMKGIMIEQLDVLGCCICLGNIYYLGLRLGFELIQKVNGFYGFMNWLYNLLMDSGGFQMVLLVFLFEVMEEGVCFCFFYDGSEILLSLEKFVQIQNVLGLDIIMQLDDVVSSIVIGLCVEEVMYRLICWLDWCIVVYQWLDKQNFFVIIQGGLDVDFWVICFEEMIKWDVFGFVIGGLSGGESKLQFWWMVVLSIFQLLKDKF